MPHLGVLWIIVSSIGVDKDWFEKKKKEKINAVFEFFKHINKSHTRPEWCDPPLRFWDKN